jgi:hypothetical protein
LLLSTLFFILFPFFILSFFNIFHSINMFLFNTFYKYLVRAVITTCFEHCSDLFWRYIYFCSRWHTTKLFRQ